MNDIEATTILTLTEVDLAVQARVGRVGDEGVEGQADDPQQGRRRAGRA
jgi:hypothetical protein